MRIRWPLWTALLLAGCLPAQQRLAPTTLSTGNYEVRCKGSCLQLQDGAAGRDGGRDRTPAADRFAARIEGLLAAGENARARFLVRKHPEAAAAALRGHVAGTPATRVELLAAAELDDLLGHAPASGWAAFLEGRGDLAHLEEVLAGTRKDNPRGNRDRARRALARADDHPEQAVRLALLLAESHRLLEDFPAAQQAWRRAAETAVRLVAFDDPDLWGRLAAERPVQAPWPQTTRSALARAMPAPVQAVVEREDFVLGAAVQFLVGRGALRRGEAATALSSFQKAESMGRFPAWDDLTRLHQARALIGLGQLPAATTLLTGLVEKKASPWHRPALAILGAAKFQEGTIAQAQAYLEEALAASGAFAGRAQAEADLGLVYLTLGRGDEGLQRLRTAQALFTEEGRLDLLLLALENEARYLEEAGRRQEAAERRSRLSTLARDGMGAPVAVVRAGR